MEWLISQAAFQNSVVVKWNGPKWYAKISAAIDFLNKIPAFTWKIWKKLDDPTYDPSIQYYHEVEELGLGDSDFFGRGWFIAWWREYWHWFFGFTLGLIFFWFESFPLVLVALMAIKEIVESYSDKKFRPKSLVDVAFHGLGSCIVYLI